MCSVPWFEVFAFPAGLPATHHPPCMEVIWSNRFWWIKCKIHQHDKNQQATEIFVHWALWTVQHYAINIFNHQCMVLVLKPLERHKIQQALSFHAAMWQYNAITWCQTEGKTAAREIWPLKQLTGSRFPSPMFWENMGKVCPTDYIRLRVQVHSWISAKFTNISQTSKHKLEDRLCFFSYCSTWAVIREL